MPQKIKGLYATDPTYYREPGTTIQKSLASEFINHEKFVKDPIFLWRMVFQCFLTLQHMFCFQVLKCGVNKSYTLYMFTMLLSMLHHNFCVKKWVLMINTISMT